MLHFHPYFATYFSPSRSTVDSVSRCFKDSVPFNDRNCIIEWGRRTSRRARQRSSAGGWGVCMHFIKAGSGDTCLLLGDVYRLVEDDPCGGLVTRRHRGGAVVRHVMLRVRQKFAHPETFNFHGLPCAIHTIDNVNFVHVHICIHVQCTRITARLLPDAVVHTADTYVVKR